jgi:hypothetical protein
MKTQPQPKPKVALELRRHHGKNGKKQLMLRYGRINKDGELVWAADYWKIGETSWLPRTLFGLLKGYIFKKLPKLDKSYETMKGPIRSALCEAAPACGCTFKENDYGGYTWHLDGKKILSLTVVNFENHRDASPKVLAQQLRKRRPKFEQMERKSGAMFRMAIVVLKGGMWMMVPAGTLPEEKRHG